MLPNPFSPSTTLPSFLSALSSNLHSPPFLTFTSFFLLGLINNVLYVIILSAALDLVGPSLPKSLVLLFDVAPSFIIKLLAPYFIHRIRYPVRVVLCVATATAGMALVALSPTGVQTLETTGLKAHVTSWLGKTKPPPPPPPAGGPVAMKMVGIALASLASGAGELSFLSLSSFYPATALAAWGSGTGAAGLVGAGAYLVATTTLGLSVRASLLAFSVLPLGMLAAYFLILPRHSVGRGEEGYAPVPTSVGEESSEGGETEDDEGEARKPATTVVGVQQRSSLAANLRRARSLVVPYMLPLFLVYLAEYAINQGIAPVLLFDLPSTPFKHYRDFYPTYGFVYQAGVFVSRSSIPFLRVDKLYLPSLLQWVNFGLLAAQAMYFSVLPSVWLVFAVIFWEGLLGGLVYVSTFRRIGEEVPPHEREFSLAATTVSDSAGILLASFLGMAVETSLCRWQVGKGRDWCKRL
ncbi:batten's disease protein Cln3 [Myriangium duriaei CBS 260.36]|uniref:Protein BTN n=1 Tax=Myriangium duriaei CBS 260.36 TaxID=1168546 RepID=A0A9P4MLF0_9PEZI|nr:batten's disease protein Cln3 [Myriangium duriaei CBS 260.36]